MTTRTPLLDTFQPTTIPDDVMTAYEMSGGPLNPSFRGIMEIDRLAAKVIDVSGDTKFCSKKLLNRISVATRSRSCSELRTVFRSCSKWRTSSFSLLLCMNCRPRETNSRTPASMARVGSAGKIRVETAYRMGHVSMEPRRTANSLISLLFAPTFPIAPGTAKRLLASSSGS